MVAENQRKAVLYLQKIGGLAENIRKIGGIKS